MGGRIEETASITWRENNQHNRINFPENQVCHCFINASERILEDPMAHNKYYEQIQAPNKLKVAEVAEEMTTQETDNFNLPLPPKMNTRGRPKEKQLTAIGLKGKRETTKAPVRFEEKTTTEKHRMLLECLVSIEDVDSALKGQLLGE